MTSEPYAHKNLNYFLNFNRKNKISDAFNCYKNCVYYETLQFFFCIFETSLLGEYS